ncbi:MAG: SprT family zinc-dependent metalloprotease [Oscillospiraceae bacterium]
MSTEGKTMEYTLIRSKRKTLALEITPDLGILVRAPLRCSKKDIERIVREHEDWILSHIEKQRERKLAYHEPTAEERLALINRAKLELPQKVAHYAEIMGLTPNGITITNAEKRYGSCSPKNCICFAWRLMQYPDAAIDYVVVHELAHIVHRNHGPDFYALIATVFPDYKQRRGLLKVEYTQ